MFTAFLEFCYIARHNVITTHPLNELQAALQRFHQHRLVFSGTVQADGLLGFSLPRQHSMVHYYDNIKNFGSQNGLCLSITGSKHITAVKRPCRRLNRYKALSQILKVNERLDKLAAASVERAQSACKTRLRQMSKSQVPAHAPVAGNALSDPDRRTVVTGYHSKRPKTCAP